MNSLNVLFVNCTLKKSPEMSNTESLWTKVQALYLQRACQTDQLRLADFNIFPGVALDEGPGDEFPQIFERILAADILVVGTPVLGGMRSSACQQLVERLQGVLCGRLDPVTGQFSLYNKVFGLVLLADAAGGSHCAAYTCYDFSRFGCVNPPNNTVSWVQAMDGEAGYIEAEGKHSTAVNREARLLVANSVALAKLLRQQPLKTDLREAAQAAWAIAQAAEVDTATLMTAKAIRTEDTPTIDGIDYRHITKRIWTVMQAGRQRGFEFKVLSLEDKIFQAMRDGKGFIYKIYPGHFSFRRQYKDYDYEQSKTRKLELMGQNGLSVPISYGKFKTFTDIPFERLKFPLVAKPDAGSLSQNVFPNLQTPEQLKQAAITIANSGEMIKLESHIAGQDYRVLILAHQYAGCVQRRAANVMGNGRHTIRELFQQRNQESGRGDRYEAHTTIHQLVFDQTSRRLLHKAGYTLDSVLGKGEIFYLQEKITASTGSDYVDYTEQLHPSIIQSCINFSHHFSTLTLGFDVITTDITKPLEETGGAFNEYNFLPYVDLHENCNVGQKRPVCRLIWDYIEAHAEEIVTPTFKPF